MKASPPRNAAGPKSVPHLCRNLSRFCQVDFVAARIALKNAGLKSIPQRAYGRTMPLSPDNLAYPNRRYGQDIARYDWSMSVDRPKRVWPDGKLVAALIIVPLEFFMLNPSGKPFKHPGAMVTPFPDLRHFTSRDYGNRVGVFRILKALKQAGLRATFPVNAVLLAKKRPLIDAALAEGHEIAAYGWDTDSIHYGAIDPVIEAEYVTKTRAAFANAGLSPRAWMSPARQQSEATPDLIKAAGFDICLDWESDSVPWTMRTDHGPVTCVPVSGEMDDRKILIDQRQSEAEWRDQILSARDLLVEEGPRFGGQVLSFTLTPYISGLPFRIWALREVLASLGADTQVWSATASEIANVQR
jgi:allantoinase